MNDNLLEMKNITKKFPGVTALKDVNFTLKNNEVHCLIGENGAGKSTLMKILTGAYTKTSGEIYLNGKEIQIKNPNHGIDLGISMIYQEFNLAPHLSVKENIFLGREKFINKSLGITDDKKMYEESLEALRRLNMEIDPATEVKNLGVAQQQMVEIAKALAAQAKIIIMDEPTSSLTDEEIDRLFGVIEQLKKEGVSIIYISHQLEESNEIGDRITVLRDGKKVDTVSADTDEDQLVQMMVGRKIENYFPDRTSNIGDEILCVENLSRAGELHNISFSVKRGEILGIAGLVGSGRTELVRAVFGADPIDEGNIFIKDKKVKIDSPNKAIEAGLGLIPENRKEEGLALDLSVRENITLPSLQGHIKKFFIDYASESEVAKEFINKIDIRTTNEEKEVRYLSGGNQQKVVIAKWLAQNSDIMFFDEPTRGIDVGAKKEIFDLIDELALQGTAIVLISSYLPEVLNMSDRILVMSRGKITGELKAEEANEEKIMSYAFEAF